MATSPASATVTAEDVGRARHAIADVAKHTPVLPSLTLTQRAGGEVALKAENLQRTGSFKIRGALNKLAALGRLVRAGGHRRERRQPRVGAGPGGARARRAVRGLHAGRGAAVEGRGLQGPRRRRAPRRHLGRGVRGRGQGARARGGHGLRAPLRRPRRRRRPGHARASSCSTTSPTWPRSWCPWAGAGSRAASAIAVKSARPEVEVVGVQVDTVASYPESLRRGEPVEVAPGLTIADGIAVKRPGELTLGARAALARRRGRGRRGRRRRGDGRAHGEGQARRRGRGRRRRGRAAGRPDRTRRARDDGRRAQRRQRRRRPAGRRSRAATRARRAGGSCSSRACPTAPARWRACSRWSARRARNLVDVEHVREGLDLHVRETAVQLVLETRGREHADDVLARVRDAGYEARVVR